MVRRVFDFNLGFAYPVRIMNQKDEAWIEQRLLDRFLRYVRIDTTSDGRSKSSPTTPGQPELARRLGLPVYGVNLPRNFVLCYFDPDYQDDPNGILFYINPSDKGSVLGLKELKAFLKHIRIDEKEFYFTPCSNVDIIERLLINLKYAYDQSGQHEKAEMLQQLIRKTAN